MDIKICSKCKIEKPLSDFYKDKSKKFGVRSNCKSCQTKVNYKPTEEQKQKARKRASDYYRRNRDVCLANQKKWRESNKDYDTERQGMWREKNKERVRVRRRNYKRKRINEDPIFKLKVNVRKRLYKVVSFKGLKKNRKTEEILGCDWETLKIHLEKTFTEGMNWDNYGEWHIDHIKPLALAKTELEVYELSHYTNLQALWAEDNIKKGSTFNFKPTASKSN